MSAGRVVVIDHPVGQTKLAELRDWATDPRKFRGLLNEIAALMVYEVTRSWPTAPRPVRTPLEETTGVVLARPITLVPILRAGLGMADGVLRLLPEARLGHLGVRRDEETLQPIAYYQKLPPDIADTEVLLVDPMLATRGQRSGSSVLPPAGGGDEHPVRLRGGGAGGAQGPAGPASAGASLHGRHRPPAEREGIHPARAGRCRRSAVRHMSAAPR
jgi:uracil phosphoribosyltransferase